MILPKTSQPSTNYIGKLKITSCDTAYLAWTPFIESSRLPEIEIADYVTLLFYNVKSPTHPHFDASSDTIAIFNCCNHVLLVIQHFTDITESIQTMTLKHATHSNDSSRLGLLDLPTEIRLRIYGYLFFDTSENISSQVDPEWHCNTCRNRIPKHLPLPRLEILRTCSIIHQEAASYLYTYAVFGFQDGYICCGCHKPTCIHIPVRTSGVVKSAPILAQIGKTNLSCIRHVFLRLKGKTFERYCGWGWGSSKSLRRGALQFLQNLASGSRLQTLGVSITAYEGFEGFLTTPGVMESIKDILKFSFSITRLDEKTKKKLSEKFPDIFAKSSIAVSSAP